MTPKGERILDYDAAFDCPSVTIGVCTRNNEKTIAKAVGSIVNVDFPRDRIEVIVVDGVSRDRTIEIAEDLLNQHSIAHGIFCDGGRGIAYARQLISDKASGGYILWVDGDNMICRSHIGKALKVMEEDPAIGVVYPRTSPVVLRGLFIEKVQTCYDRSITSPLEKNVGRGESCVATSLGMQGTLVRVKAIRDVGGFDSSFVAAEDIDIFIRLNSQGWKLRPANVTLYYFARDSWKDVFRQAMWWNIGRYLVARKHDGLIHPLLGFVSRIPNRPAQTNSIFTHIADSWATWKKALTTFASIDAAAVPVYHLYRRTAYLVGYVYVTCALRHSSRRSEHE